MRHPNKQLDSGFTLVEVIVALSIFAIVALAITAGLLSNTSANRKVDDQTIATRIIEQTLERYRQTNDYGSLISLPPATQNVTVNDRTYQVVTTFCSSSRGTDLIQKMPCNSAAVFIEVEVKQGNTSFAKAATYFTKFGAVNG